MVDGDPPDEGGSEIPTGGDVDAGVGGVAVTGGGCASWDATAPSDACG